MEINDENSSSMEYNSEDVNELIIHYVRSRPQLWDFKKKKYRERIKKKLWCEVAQELNVTDEFVKNRWRNLRDRYIKEKKKSVTRSGQAALHFSPWPLMASLSFLSDVVEPRKTVTNYPSFDIECPLSSNTLSPAPSETEEYDTYDTQESQVDNMWDTNTRQTGQTEICTPRQITKRQLPETRTDAVDEAILSLVQKQTSTDTMNSDDLFYLSISRDSQHLNVNTKLRLKTLVLEALSQVVAEEQNKT